MLRKFSSLEAKLKEVKFGLKLLLCTMRALFNECFKKPTNKIFLIGTVVFTSVT